MIQAKPLRLTLGNDLQIEEIPASVYRYLTDTLEIPNPRWLDNERMGRWNRETPKILSFYTRTSAGGLSVPRGFTGNLIHFCRTNNLPYHLQDNRRMIPPVDFIFPGFLKPFQTTAVEAVSRKHFGILSAPTGSGKTVMAIASIAMRRQPALIIVHTKDLLVQWVKCIEQFLGIPETDIGVIGAGKKMTGAFITVALVQSLYKYTDQILSRTGYLIVDECHRCPSRTFTEVVSRFDSYYMLGLSATPWRRDNLSQLIFWYLGDARYSVSKNQLVQSGDILPAEIIVRPTRFKSHYDPSTAYSKMLSELTADDRRNHLIALDVATEVENNNGICLVLSDRKHHCEILKAILSFRYKISVELLTGDSNMKQRAAVLSRLTDGDASILIATGQLLGEGFDFPNMSSLFLTTPIRFSGRVLQYIGRVLRPASGKKQARIFDYVDVHVDVLQSAANARQKVYHGSGDE